MSDPAWHHDPTNRHEYRYWNGAHWTEHVSDNGAQSIDDCFDDAPTSTTNTNTYNSDPTLNQKRFVAFLLDIAIFIFTAGTLWTIWALIVFFMGTTPGKQLLGLRVVHAKTKAPVGWWRMFLREIVIKWFPFNISYVIVLIPMVMVWSSIDGAENNLRLTMLMLYGIPGMVGGCWLFVNGWLIVDGPTRLSRIVNQRPALSRIVDLEANEFNEESTSDTRPLWTHLTRTTVVANVKHHQYHR